MVTARRNGGEGCVERGIGDLVIVVTPPADERAIHLEGNDMVASGSEGATGELGSCGSVAHLSLVAMLILVGAKLILYNLRICDFRVDII